MSTGSSAPPRQRSTGNRLHDWVDAFNAALALPDPTPHGWHGAGIGTRAERVLNVAGSMVLVLFAIGWGWSIANARTLSDPNAVVTPATGTITAALTKPGAP